MPYAPVLGLCIWERDLDYLTKWMTDLVSSPHFPSRPLIWEHCCRQTNAPYYCKSDWYLTTYAGAFGSSLGGLAASKIGTSACFYLDSLTYLLAALCAYRLKARAFSKIDCAMSNISEMLFDVLIFGKGLKAPVATIIMISIIGSSHTR